LHKKWLSKTVYWVFVIADSAAGTLFGITGFHAFAIWLTKERKKKGK